VRKPIQIAVSPEATENQIGLVYALCDDGTIWFIPEKSGAEWQPLPPIPQGFLRDEDEIDGN
jgi:hypothetical protein